jgi:putative lipoic acid-binding regulatory protein
MHPGDDDTPFEFPCEFPIKALGRAVIGFDTTVVEIVRRHVPDLGEGAVRSQASRGGRFISVTVTITATSRAQLDAIYRDLSACDAVVMAL